MRSYYDILGISLTATSEEIKKSFKQLVFRYHPDKNKNDPNASSKLKEVNDAFAVLNDPLKKLKYDESFKHINRTGRHSTDFGDFIASSWNDADFSYHWWQSHKVKENSVEQPTRPRGEDVDMELMLTFHESIIGCEKYINVSSMKDGSPCNNCGGTGASPGTRLTNCVDCFSRGHIADFTIDEGPNLKICQRCGGSGKIPIVECRVCGGNGKIKTNDELKIKIPSGIKEGQRLRIVGKGKDGSPPGDLYLNVKISAHPNLTRDGQDIRVKIWIPFLEAIRGTRKIINSMNGIDGMIEVNIPSGVNQGQEIKIKNAGIQSQSGKSCGDMIVTVNISTPEIKTKRAKELIELLAAELEKQDESKK